MADCDGPCLSRQDHLASKKSPQRAGRLNGGQIYEKHCVYHPEEFGVYPTAKEVTKVFYKDSDLHFRFFCSISAENKLRRGAG